MMTRNFKFKSVHDVVVQIYDAKADKNNEMTAVLLPAIGVPIVKYERFIHQLSQIGFTVIAADYPYCGANTPHVNKSINYNYRDLIEGFIPELLKQSSTKKTILIGHSLGGHLATLFATTTTIPVIGIATGNVHYANWQGIERLKILGFAAFIKSMCKVYGYFPGYKVGFGRKETKDLMKNWCHTVLHGNYTFYADPLPKADVLGYFISIHNDSFAPLRSTESLADNFLENQIVIVKLPVETKGNPHSAWLKNPEAIVSHIKNYRM
ncbi:alpha/beta fold hydrolase [Psychrobacter sp. PAMC 21119]|jgi:predicted alpha/beta hydrolase|uniref:alpha/beta fold hydrolase n=1 Tax=Psychrobacter sp. PAMC 21119 TaxID=1112209 RepID=UPI000289E849|nr:alpha/beta fold hydrolase [Psychrobacter sp. PAMC 21119]